MCNATLFTAFSCVPRQRRRTRLVLMVISEHVLFVLWTPGLRMSSETGLAEAWFAWYWSVGQATEWTWSKEMRQVALMRLSERYKEHDGQNPSTRIVVRWTLSPPKRPNEELMPVF